MRYDVAVRIVGKATHLLLEMMLTSHRGMQGAGQLEDDAGGHG